MSLPICKEAFEQSQKISNKFHSFTSLITEIEEEIRNEMKNGRFYTENIFISKYPRKTVKEVMDLLVGHGYDVFVNKDSRLCINWDLSETKDEGVIE